MRQNFPSFHPDLIDSFVLPIYDDNINEERETIVIPKQSTDKFSE